MVRVVVLEPIPFCVLKRVTLLLVEPGIGQVRWTGNKRLPLALLSRLSITATRSRRIVSKFERPQDPPPLAERRCDDEIVVAASRLQAEPASLARLEGELLQLAPHQLAPGRMLRDS